MSFQQTSEAVPAKIWISQAVWWRVAFIIIIILIIIVAKIKVTLSHKCWRGTVHKSLVAYRTGSCNLEWQRLSCHPDVVDHLRPSSESLHWARNRVPTSPGWHHPGGVCPPSSAFQPRRGCAGRKRKQVRSAHELGDVGLNCPIADELNGPIS